MALQFHKVTALPAAASLEKDSIYVVKVGASTVATMYVTDSSTPPNAILVGVDPSALGSTNPNLTGALNVAAGP